METTGTEEGSENCDLGQFVGRFTAVFPNCGELDRNRGKLPGESRLLDFRAKTAGGTCRIWRHMPHPTRDRADAQSDEGKLYALFRAAANRARGFRGSGCIAIPSAADEKP